MASSPPVVRGEPANQAAKETLEDYTLRFAPRSYRRWKPGVVATTALGGIAYFADFSIGAGIGLTYGTLNALAAILVAADIILNKHLLGLSPREPEFRRGMLYAVNPVGVVSFLAAAGISIAVYFGVFGAAVQPFSPIAAVIIALVLTPAMAIATRGRYYLRRTDDGIAEPRFDSEGAPVATTYACHVCEQEFERPDVLACFAHEAVICSLCVTTDRTGEHVRPADPPRTGR